MTPKRRSTTPPPIPPPIQHWKQASCFPLKNKRSIILLHFYQKLSKFSEIFPTICAFRPNARKIKAWYVKFFEKYAKIIHF